MNCEYKKSKHITDSLVKLIKSILNGEVDERLNYDGSVDSFNVTLKSNKKSYRNLFSTGWYYSEYLLEDNSSMGYTETHYFAFDPNDSSLVVNIRQCNGKRTREKLNTTGLNIDTEEEWFQYSTLYDDNELFSIMLWCAFKKENFPSCLVEFSEFFKYLEETNAII